MMPTQRISSNAALPQSQNAKWLWPLGKEFSGTRTQAINLLGGKGAALQELLTLGIPTPPGFVLTTDVCNWFYAQNKTLPPDFSKMLRAGVQTLEEKTQRLFTNQLPSKAQNQQTAMPLLLSVRSGARASMPGMMDTILNLGMNDQTVQAVAGSTGNACFAFDTYRRFIQMYSHVVLGLPMAPFEDMLLQYRQVRGVSCDSDLNADDLKKLTRRFLDHVKNATEKPFPQDPYQQLMQAVQAVFSSWMNKRAVTYRRLYDIPQHWGTAVTVQAMVFGNKGKNSGTGVAFTRHPSTGAPELFGEYLMQAQGEDVVAGIRTPLPLSMIQEKEARNRGLEKDTLQSTAHKDGVSLQARLPKVFDQLCQIKSTLEHHFKDMQDIEFTLEEGHLWILQTRAGKRSGAAALKISTDMRAQKLLTTAEALSLVNPKSLDQILHPGLAPNHGLALMGKGLPGAPGGAAGRIAFSCLDVQALKNKGESAVLVRHETSPEDIGGMQQAKGILTACGGMTSHAAVVARGMGKPCVVGASDVRIDYAQQTLILGGHTLSAGDFISLDGASGQIFCGQAPLQTPELSDDFFRFMHLAEETKRLDVRANADTPKDLEKALSLGACGVGLCRTEHMFFESARLLAMQRMILADSGEERGRCAQALLPMQKEDFTRMLHLLKGKPFTVRLLDPPLHEFLPKTDHDKETLSQTLGMKKSKLLRRLEELSETNPMLGNRGCRLGITMPEIYAMQVQGLVQAALTLMQDAHRSPVSAMIVKKNTPDCGATQTPDPVNDPLAVPVLEIMVPLISLAGEFSLVRRHIETVIQNILNDPIQNPLKLKVPYKIGAMIELPRAALKADKIAKEADFLSFGTNDLTQTTFGFSRDDVGSFLGTYRNKGLLERDPFVSLDQSGVGELIRIATEKARQTNPLIKLGVCGEQGADPASVAFFDALGLDSISCSPYRVPMARLAAAHSALGITRFL